MVAHSRGAETSLKLACKVALDRLRRETCDGDVPEGRGKVHADYGPVTFECFGREAALSVVP
jgi:hypothetical protein